MPLDQILTLLVQERDRLNRAIEALQAPSQIKRRGRPPQGASAATDGISATTAKTPRKKRTFSAAQRKKQAERMRAYWAAKRKQAK